MSSVFQNIHDKIKDIMDKVKSVASNAVEKLKSAFDFEWKLPEIKLPHFSIDGEFSLNPPSVPKFSVDWYAKGGVFNSAQLIGVGEDGAEAVVPLEKNLGWIKNLVNELVKRLSSFFGFGTKFVDMFEELKKELSRLNDSIGDLGTNFGSNLANETFFGTMQAQKQNDESKKAANQITGNSFNFYSNSKLSEIESAKEMKKVIAELEMSGV